MPEMTGISKEIAATLYTAHAHLNVSLRRVGHVAIIPSGIAWRLTCINQERRS